MWNAAMDNRGVAADVLSVPASMPASAPSRATNLKSPVAGSTRRTWRISPRQRRGVQLPRPMHRSPPARRPRPRPRPRRRFKHGSREPGAPVRRVGARAPRSTLHRARLRAVGHAHRSAPGRLSSLAAGRIGYHRRVRSPFTRRRCAHIRGGGLLFGHARIREHRPALDPKPRSRATREATEGASTATPSMPSSLLPPISRRNGRATSPRADAARARGSPRTRRRAVEPGDRRQPRHLRQDVGTASSTSTRRPAGGRRQRRSGRRRTVVRRA